MNQKIEHLIYEAAEFANDLSIGVAALESRLNIIVSMVQDETEKAETQPTTPGYPQTITPQMQSVLTHLRTKGSITSLEALGVYNIYRLAARVKELRNLGYNINTERKQDYNGKQYARYSLDACHKY